MGKQDLTIPSQTIINVSDIQSLSTNCNTTYVDSLNSYENLEMKSTIDQQQQQKSGIRLDFKNIDYSVSLKNFKKKQILHNISGYVCPGEILYIMGPSGSGKTTLLDFLNNRTPQSPKNNVFLNQKQWSEREFRKIARYVEQYPHFHEILTVKETLEIAAHFFVPSKKERKQKVSQIIKQLGLEDQANTRIGGSLFRGISGGQKQRVAIGEQLVTNPKILFLDEPTSGLDSTAAYQLMEKLKQVCVNGQITAICSIHQPSQRVFDIADRQLILAGGKNFGGHTVYFGRTSNLNSYLREINISNTTKCSISEWILDQINADFMKENTQTTQTMIEKFQNSSQKANIDSQQQPLENRNSLQKFKFDVDQVTSCRSLEGDIIKIQQSQLRDFWILFQRSFKINFKHPVALIARLFTYCGMAGLLGMIWYKVLENPSDDDIQRILKVIFFASVFFSSMTICVLPNYIEDRMIMVKERQNGQYKLWVFSLQNFLVDVIFTFILSLACGSICFYCIGFQYTDENVERAYFVFIANLFVNLMVSESLMQLITYIFSDQMICIMIAALLAGLNMLLSGFMIKYKDIPVYWMFYYYLNFNNYSFQNFVTGAFENIQITQDTPQGPMKYPGTFLLKDIDQENVNIDLNFAIMIGFVLAFRTSSFLYSYIFHNGKK